MEFSIIIPTFNNLNYLKLCIKSLLKNSKYKHELIFHINEGADGTLNYIKDQNYKYSFSETNVGMCISLNEAVKLSSKKYLVIGHDDMYFCPGWDQSFEEEIKKYPADKNFFISGSMIQPFPSFIELDCGKTINDFNEEKLLKNFNTIKFKNFQGTHWQPSLIPKKTWDLVGGFSEEFSPGAGSDPDFNMKLWNIGVRLFKGLESSRVYHFASMTLRKRVSNNGAKTFLLKWGISIKFFKKYYLKSDTLFIDELAEPQKNIDFYLNYAKCRIQFYYYKVLQILKI